MWTPWRRVAGAPVTTEGEWISATRWSYRGEHEVYWSVGASCSSWKGTARAARRLAAGGARWTAPNSGRKLMGRGWGCVWSKLDEQEGSGSRPGFGGTREQQRSRRNSAAALFGLGCAGGDHAGGHADIGIVTFLST